MDDLIYELIELVKTLSPELWRIGVSQVRAEIISHAVADIILLLLTILTPIVLSHIAKREVIKENADGVRFLAIPIMFFLGGGLLIDLLTLTLPMALNPEFYAIKIIMSLVK